MLEGFKCNKSDLIWPFLQLHNYQWHGGRNGQKKFFHLIWKLLTKPENRSCCIMRNKSLRMVSRYTQNNWITWLLTALGSCVKVSGHTKLTKGINFNQLLPLSLMFSPRKLKKGYAACSFLLIWMVFLDTVDWYEAIP